MRLTEVGQLACQTLQQVAQVIQKKVEASFPEFEENGESELSLASNDICFLKNTV